MDEAPAVAGMSRVAFRRVQRTPAHAGGRATGPDVPDGMPLESLESFDLDADERALLVSGLTDWFGPLEISEALAVALGFHGVEDMWVASERQPAQSAPVNHSRQGTGHEPSLRLGLPSSQRRMSGPPSEEGPTPTGSASYGEYSAKCRARSLPWASSGGISSCISGHPDLAAVERSWSGRQRATHEPLGRKQVLAGHW